MKHQKIIDDLIKDFEFKVWHPLDFASYRAAREFRTAEQRKTIDQMFAKPVDHMNVQRSTYLDGAGRERDIHGHLVHPERRTTEQMIAENDLLKPIVQHMHRSIVEKFFGLWEGALQPKPKTSRVFDQAIDTSKPLPARRPSYYTALRWPGLYQ